MNGINQLGQKTNSYIGALNSDLRTFLSVLGILLLGWAVNKAVRRLLKSFFSELEKRAPSIEEGRRLHTVERVIGHSSSLLVFVLTGMLVLNKIGISIAPILGAAGVVGLAVGFGAQSLVKDTFAGFFILIENQIRVGDFVEIAGKSGSVEELTLRRTKLRDYNGDVHYISNGLITTVTNTSSDFSYAVIQTTVALSQNLSQVFDVLKQISEEMRKDPFFSEKIRGNIEITGVEEIGDSTLTIRSRIKTEPLEQHVVRREFLKRLQIKILENSIKTPVRQQIITLRQEPSA